MLCYLTDPADNAAEIAAVGPIREAGPSSACRTTWASSVDKILFDAAVAALEIACLDMSSCSLNFLRTRCLLDSSNSLAADIKVR